MTSAACAMDGHADCLGATEDSRLCVCECHTKCGCGAELVTDKELFTGDCTVCDRLQRDYPGY